MKLLAIESSSLVASVALTLEGRVLAEYTTDFKKTHSQTLMPMIDEICRMSETDLNTIDAIAISKGPGSFTGLRIGAAVAKGLALALDKKIIPVSTLATLAYNHAGYQGLIVPIMDARRDQVYAGIYSFENKPYEEVCKTCVNMSKSDLVARRTTKKMKAELVEIMKDMPISIAELLEKLSAVGQETIFLGDGVPAFKDIIDSSADFPYIYSPMNLNRQKASGVAALAEMSYMEGQVVDGCDFSPEYFRPSQAERMKNS